MRLSRPSGGRRSRLVALSGLLVLAAGCGDDNPADGGNPTGTVVVQFDHVVAGDPLVFDQMNYTNAAGNQYSVTKLQYLISRFRLHIETVPGTDYESDAVHLRDGRDDATHGITFDDVPAGDYSELSFRFGLTNEDNLTGAYPEYDAAMEWPPAMGEGGYHYMKCEGESDASVSSFTTHTGRSVDGVDRSFEVSLPLDAGGLRHGFEVLEGETATIRVRMDLNQWYQDPHAYDLGMGPIMGNPTVQQTLYENGSPDFGTGVFSLAP